MMIAVIAPILLVLSIKLWRDFVGGLAFALAVMVSITGMIRIETPGAMPELTVHRLVFLFIAAAWMLKSDRKPLASVPLARPIVIWAVVAFISFLGSADKVTSIKRYLEFVFELFAFYFILFTTIHTREDAYRLLRAAVVGVVIVSAMAILEKYTGVNLVDRYVAADPESLPNRDIRATYRHRILLGTGMAMGWPIALATMRVAQRATSRFLCWIAVAGMMAACYFAMSRGPWIGSAMAAFVIVALGTGSLRKPLVALGCVGFIGLLFMPGVVDTLTRSASDTMDSDSFKGGTFQYRLELWAVAFEGIRHSIWTFLFGLGPAAGYGQTIVWELSYRGKDHSIYSWDNDFAYSLYQYGFVGLTATLVVYGSVALRLFREARASSGIQRDFYACLSASTFAFFFMMSNVHIFARQIHYLFWALTAVGFCAISRFNEDDSIPDMSADLGDNGETAFGDDDPTPGRPEFVT